MRFVCLLSFKLLLVVAFLSNKNVLAIPQFRQTIQDANNTLMEGNYPQATAMFIKGYWELRKVLTDIWYKADPMGGCFFLTVEKMKLL